MYKEIESYAIFFIGMKALQVANETFIRINEEGIMCK